MDNFIEIYDNALSDSTSDFLIKCFKDKKYQEHLTTGMYGGNQINTEVKDSTDLDLIDSGRDNYPPEIFEEFANSLRLYLGKYFTKYSILGGPGRKMWEEGDGESICKYMWGGFSIYPFSILLKRYRKNIQGYHSFHADQGEGQPSIFRQLVCMYYLNDVKKGGETEFLNQKLKVKPKKGTLVIFPAFYTHLHKGHIPTSNDKYIMNFWVMRGAPGVDKLNASGKDYFLIHENGYI